MRITAEGKIGIGVAAADIPGSSSVYDLFVDGGIATRDVQVKIGPPWPDFVFDAGHHLIPLDQLRTYLCANRHLPGIPSAAQVEANGGVELGDLQARMLKVVEEQALYILQLEERLGAMEQRMKALEESK